MLVIHLSLNNARNRRRSSLLAIQTDGYNLKPVLLFRFKTGKDIITFYVAIVYYSSLITTLYSLIATFFSFVDHFH